MKSVRLAIFALALCASTAQAQTTPPQASGIAIEDAWSRPTPAASAGQTGVVYLTITDKGAPDKLTGASTPIAASATLHQSSSVKGVVKMRAVDALPVAKDAPIKLAPGGYHLMLMGLKQPLKLGQSFPLTLTFASAGAVTTTVVVSNNADAAKPAGDMDGMGDMGGMDMSGMK